MIRMEQLDQCPACAGERLQEIYPPNDLRDRPGVDEDMKRSDFTICHDCGLIFARWRQTPESFPEYYRLFAELEHRTYAVFPPPASYLKGKSTAAAEIAQLLGEQDLIRPDARILHVRADGGFLMAHLRDNFGVREIYGLDLFESNIRLAREQLKLEHVEPLNLGLVSIPFPEVRFDVIILNHFVTHAARPVAALQTVREQLGDGGRLFVYNDYDHMLGFQRGADFLPQGINNFHKQLTSKQSLLNVLALAGFDGQSVGMRQHCPLVLAAPAAPKAIGDLTSVDVAADIATFESWIEVHEQLRSKQILFAVPSGKHLRFFVQSGFLKLLRTRGMNVIVAHPPGNFDEEETEQWHGLRRVTLPECPQADQRRRLPFFKPKHMPFGSDPHLDTQLAELSVDMIVLAAPPATSDELRLLAAADRCGIPVTLLVMDWPQAIAGSPPRHAECWIAWTARMREELSEALGVKRNKIKVGGPLLGDALYNLARFGSREENLRRLGIDAEAPMVVLALSSPGPDLALVSAAERIAAAALASSWQLIIRLQPEFSEQSNPQIERRLEALRGERVHVEQPRVLRGSIPQAAPQADLDHWVRLVRDAAVVITDEYACALDGIALDKPTILLEAERALSAAALTPGAMGVTLDPDRLTELVEEGIGRPDRFAAQRKEMVKIQLGSVDGRSQLRAFKKLASAILSSKAMMASPV